MAIDLSECEKILLVDTTGHPYIVGGTTSTDTVKLGTCDKYILVDTSGEVYSAA